MFLNTGWSSALNRYKRRLLTQEADLVTTHGMLCPIPSSSKLINPIPCHRDVPQQVGVSLSNMVGYR